MNAAWVVEYQATTGAALGFDPALRVHDVSPCRAPVLIGFFRLTLANVTPGTEFRYRIRRNEEIVFTAVARAPNSLTNRIGLYRLGTVGQELPSKSRSLIRPSLPGRISS